MFLYSYNSYARDADLSGVEHSRGLLSPRLDRRMVSRDTVRPTSWTQTTVPLAPAACDISSKRGRRPRFDCSRMTLKAESSVSFFGDNHFGSLKSNRLPINQKLVSIVSVPHDDHETS